jgi:hypothetical protein
MAKDAYFLMGDFSALRVSTVGERRLAGRSPIRRIMHRAAPERE